MTRSPLEVSVPVFEIDQPERYGQYLLHNPLECLIQLRALQAQQSLATIYLDAGEQFFLSSVLAVDEASNGLLVDAANRQDLNSLATRTERLTLTASVDKVQLQFRLEGPLQLVEFEGRQALRAELPDRILRLQRREFFRVLTPRSTPLRCKFAMAQPREKTQIFDYVLHDLSGGGLSLIGAVEDAEKFAQGTLLHDCRLDIPGESVLSVNLKICEIRKSETLSGEHRLRLGCEFISLPGTRQTLIERYVARLERTHNAREHGQQH